jgi:hypothetical protein
LHAEAEHEGADQYLHTDRRIGVVGLDAESPPFGQYGCEEKRGGGDQDELRADRRGLSIDNHPSIRCRKTEGGMIKHEPQEPTEA